MFAFTVVSVVDRYSILFEIKISTFDPWRSDAIFGQRMYDAKGPQLYMTLLKLLAIDYYGANKSRS